MFSSNTSSAEGGYQISRSLRFNSADSAYLNRTPASAGNRRTFTVSLWVKRAALGTLQYLWEGGSPDSITTRLFLRFQTDDTLRMATSGTVIFNTTQVFRDPSAWYHIVVAVDTPNATQANRTRLYVNGTEVTTFSSSSPFSQNDDTGWNMAQAHSIGRSHIDGTGYLGAYLTEMYNIDGQTLTPSSFGETNAQTGVWQPKAYSGSYGTNGFYLNFSDNSNTTAATLGKDYSGNGNNWTPNNFSVSAGAGNDSLVDTPTPYGTDTGAGGTVRGNYCTWNPLDRDTATTYTTYSNGNLDCTVTGTRAAVATVAVTSGKWYWEVVPTGNTGSVNYMIGVADANTPITTRSYTGANGWAYFQNGNKFNNNSGSSYGSSYTTNDVIGVALDMDAGTVTFYKNNVSQGTAFSTLSGKAIQPMVSDGSSVHTMNYTANFGQRPFAYTAPSGYKALCTQNLPTPTIGATSTTQADDFFNPVLYTGTGATRTVTGVNFAPDFVWIKSRSAAYNNRLYDRVRGVENVLQSNTTAAEASDGGGLTAFGSDGFTLGSSVSQNENGSTFVAWNWKANGAGSSNTAGSITSTVSANTTSGFSIVTYTGTGANATIGHGLGVAPRMIIVKRRNGADIWPVYHESIGNTQYLRLQGDNPAGTFNVWQNTSPTSSVFYISTDSTVNTNTGTYVAYCFAEVAGYSRFGSYTGNGSTDGPFVFCGFRPKYVMYKNSTNSGSWIILDASRSTSNVASARLLANTSDAEADGTHLVDFLSNGFKLRNSNTNGNESGSTHIFAAFAEFPQKFSLAR